MVLPSMVLDYLSEQNRLGPGGALVVSMLFPLGFGVWCWKHNLGWNLFSTLGLITVLLSGGLGLLKLDPLWFSIKESAMPLVLGAAFPLSHYWGQPLIRSLLLQPHLINLPVLEAALLTGDRQARFRRSVLHASRLLGLGVAASAVANFFLAMWLLGEKAPGSEAFVKGIGTLNWASLVVIGVPLMGVMLLVFIRLVRDMQGITGLSKADLMATRPTHPLAPSDTRVE